jgi:hypothetical protein
VLFCRSMFIDYESSAYQYFLCFLAVARRTLLVLSFGERWWVYWRAKRKFRVESPNHSTQRLCNFILKRFKLPMSRRRRGTQAQITTADLLLLPGQPRKRSSTPSCPAVHTDHNFRRVGRAASTSCPAVRHGRPPRRQPDALGSRSVEYCRRTFCSLLSFRVFWQGFFKCFSTGFYRNLAKSLKKRLPSRSYGETILQFVLRRWSKK